MHDPDVATPAVTLNADIDVAHTSAGTPERVLVRIKIANHDSLPIAVVGTGSQGEDDAPLPAFRMSQGGDLTLERVLIEPQAGRLAMPPTVYAMQVAAGDTHSAQISARILSAYPHQDGTRTQLVTPERVRFCQGIVPFNEADFARSGNGKNAWRTPPGSIEAQVTLCSDWVTLTG
ncbi:MAG: hypothetical protein AAFU65_02845 [Pseudomonadota bacterium]